MTEDGQRIELDSVYDLEKLDDADLERGDEITLHYRSHRSSDGKKVVSRDVEYQRHIAEGWIGRFTCRDDRLTIELDKEKAKERGSLFLLSKGQRCTRLGFLEAVTIPGDSDD